ncbi:hypothetical protein [Paenibacillus sp. Leaf72]|uniref:hypothetical protein n=1 Tax=Paenibacillus sp. Leaf72 TaxID=1736234 RepID=UPI0006FEBC42|nr:hypothetical protein [Paenibacillus sp. Leaf72]KQN96768.1 hypothetical protein ASF12_22095 [Paenibacillus sp. Leaf72]
MPENGDLGTNLVNDTKLKLKEELLDYFSNQDPLYSLIKGFEHEIVSDDIIELDPQTRYSTNDVTAILQKYTYLYDVENETSYIADPSRLRWWLLEKQEDNLLAYLSVAKTGKNWTWDIHAIVRAKIVSILRYIHGYTQKEIKVFALGVSAKTTSRITDTNIESLIKTGELNNIQNFDVLKDALIQYMNFNQKRFEELAQSIEYFATEYRKDHESTLSTIKNSENELKRRTLLTDLRLRKIHQKRLIALEAEQAWINRGRFKNMMASKEAKRSFIESYIEQGMKTFLEEEQILTNDELHNLNVEGNRNTSSDE